MGRQACVSYGAAEFTRDVLMDAHLAALAIENDAILHTTDRNFRRFEGVQVRNPLIS